MKLTEALANTNSRVDALETADLDENAPIARITKIYGGIKITAAVGASLHQYWICGQSYSLFLTPWQPSEEVITCSEELIL